MGLAGANNATLLLPGAVEEFESNESPTAPRSGVLSRRALQCSSKMAKSSIILQIGRNELVTVEIFLV